MAKKAKPSKHKKEKEKKSKQKPANPNANKFEVLESIEESPEDSKYIISRKY